MSAIDQYIALIRNAVYGREVRGAIADGIQQCYTDSLANASMIADEFSTSVAYNTGDFVVKDGVLYIFTSDHSAGSWNPSEVDEINILDAVDVKASEAHEAKLLEEGLDGRVNELHNLVNYDYDTSYDGPWIDQNGNAVSGTEVKRYGTYLYVKYNMTKASYANGIKLNGPIVFKNARSDSATRFTPGLVLTVGRTYCLRVKKISGVAAFQVGAMWHVYQSYDRVTGTETITDGNDVSYSVLTFTNDMAANGVIPAIYFARTTSGGNNYDCELQVTLEDITETVPKIEDTLATPYRSNIVTYLRSGTIKVDGNHYVHSPSSSGNVKQHIITGNFRSVSSSIDSLSITTNDLMPIGAYGDAIHLRYFWNSLGQTIDRLVKVGYQFCSVSNDTVTKVGSSGILFGTPDVLLDATISVPNGATHVMLCYSFGSGVNAVVYDVTLTVDSVIPDSNLASVDNLTATASHSTGSYILAGGKLYKATSDISVGNYIPSFASQVTIADNLEEIEADMDGAVIRYDSAQSLNWVNKLQACTNSGAMGNPDFNAINRYCDIRIAQWEPSGYYKIPAVNETATMTFISTFETAPSRMACIMDIAPGEMLFWSGKAGASNVGNMAWGFVDANNVVLSRSDSSLNGRYIATAPAGSSKVIINNYSQHDDVPDHDQYAFIAKVPSMKETTGSLTTSMNSLHRLIKYYGDNSYYSSSYLGGSRIGSVVTSTKTWVSVSSISIVILSGNGTYQQGADNVESVSSEYAIDLTVGHRYRWKLTRVSGTAERIVSGSPAKACDAEIFVLGSSSRIKAADHEYDGNVSYTEFEYTQAMHDAGGILPAFRIFRSTAGPTFTNWVANFTLEDITEGEKDLPAAPTANGTYTLKCTVSSGVPTYSWVADT